MDPEDILKEIIELAYLLSWETAMAENKDGELVGLYIGTPTWLKSKTGTPNNPTH
jgi:hypothetical protein